MKLSLLTMIHRFEAFVAGEEINIRAKSCPLFLWFVHLAARRFIRELVNPAPILLQIRLSSKLFSSSDSLHRPPSTLKKGL